MGRLDPNLTAFEASDVDVWDRVRALAPSSTPVRGRLFTGAKTQAKGQCVAAPKSPDRCETVKSRGAGPDPDQRPTTKRHRAERPKPVSESIDTLYAFAPKLVVEPSEVAKAVPAVQPRGKGISAFGVARRTAPTTAPTMDGRDETARAWARLRPAVMDAADPTQTLQASVARMAENAVSQSFDQLRMRLLQTLRDNGWRRVAITSPTPGCGSTFVACNLTVSLSRIREQRTVLMDLNLRAPGVAKAFALRTETNIAGYLAGGVSVSQSIQRYQDNVALAAGRSCATATAEMLYDTRTITALKQLEQDLRPDVMLFDLPPMLAYDDVTAFLPQVDGVLLVSNGTKTMGKDIEACERAIAGRTKLLGVVMNQARKRDCKAAGYRNA